jgi:hypothetical protein
MTTFANKKALGVLLGVAAAIVLTACGRSDDDSSTSNAENTQIRDASRQAIGSTYGFKITFVESHDELMAKGGACRADPSYPDPASDTKRTHIAKVEFSDAGEGRCKITFTLGQFQDKESVLNGGKFSFTGKYINKDSAVDWTCSSDLPDKYVPKECRSR